MPKKIFIDSTLFLRSIKRDHPAQTEAAVRLFQSAASGDIQLITNLTALSELAFILDLELENGLPRQEIRHKVNNTLNTLFIETVDMPLIIHAMYLYATSTIKLGDAFIAAWMQEQGVDTLQTFDHHFDQIQWLVAKNPEIDPLIPPRRQFADTNIFLGAIRPRSTEQESAIRRLFHAGSIDQIQLITNETVILEMVYIMQFGWRMNKGAIRKNILAIINDPAIEIINVSIIVHALRLYETLDIKIDKAMNAAWMMANEIDTIYTFDADYGRIPTITAQTPQ